MSQIKICTGHKKQVPLLWTFAFNGSEYWCPYCGMNYGMLGAGEMVETTIPLLRAKVEWQNKTKDYLHARGTKVCSYIMWEGEQITPDQLPQEEKDRIDRVINEWKYENENLCSK